MLNVNARSILLACMVAGIASSPAAAVEPPTPRLLVRANEQMLRVRPARLDLGDRAGILRRVHWHTWSQRTAQATGQIMLDDCVPDCARGRYLPHPVRVRASRARAGVFTRLRLSYRDAGRQLVDRRALGTSVEPDGRVYYWWSAPL